MVARWKIALLLLPIGLLSITSIWAYCPFQDGRYDLAWWSLASFGKSELPAEDAISTGIAVITVVISAIIAGTVATLSIGGNQSMRIVLGSLVALIWMSSPWQVAVLQFGGPWMYLWVLIPTILAVIFARALLKQYVLPSGIAILVCSIGIQLLISPARALPNLVSVVLPSQGELSPWRSYGDESVSIVISMLLVVSLLMSAMMSRLEKYYPQTFLPACFFVLCIPTLNVFMLSEQVQVRANPRLALLYSLAYSDGSPVELWLASEYFEIMGDAEAARDYRKRVKSSDISGIPRDYHLPLKCVRDEAINTAFDEGAVESQLLEYLRLHKRC